MIDSKIHPKGTKFLIEVELVKDMDSFDTFIMQSLYGEKRDEGINGELKVNVLYHQTIDELRESLKIKCAQIIDQL